MMFKRLRTMIKNQAGLTLLELLLALVIASIITSTAAMVVFQVFDGEARSSNHIDAISRVQDAGSYVSTDAGMAQSWNNEDDPATSELELLTMTWTEWESNDVYKVAYSIVDNELQRMRYINEGLDTTYVFEHVYYTHPDTGDVITHCEYDSETEQLNFTLTAVVGVGSQQEVETRVYEVTPRPSI